MYLCSRAYAAYYIYPNRGRALYSTTYSNLHSAAIELLKLIAILVFTWRAGGTYYAFEVICYRSSTFFPSDLKTFKRIRFRTHVVLTVLRYTRLFSKLSNTNNARGLNVIRPIPLAAARFQVFYTAKPTPWYVSQTSPSHEDIKIETISITANYERVHANSLVSKLAS